MVRSRRSPRRGFTLLETLVVISIIGLLASLLLPAVQAARDSARRAHCANNLRQIGLALHNYHESSQTFPINMISPGMLSNPPDYAAPRPFSALTRILPYLEQASLFSSINYEVWPYPVRTDTDFDYPQNQTAYATSVATYLCPADGMAARSPRGCSYRGNYGVGPSSATFAETYDSGVGFYTWPAVLSVASFPDGLSHTAAYAERLLGTGGGTAIDPDRDMGNIQLYLYSCERDADYALLCCRAAASNGFPGSRRAGFTWFFGDFECAAYSHAQAPNGPIPDGLDLSPRHWGIATARSRHAGGANVLMADGSTRFVTDGIAQRVWRGLGTRNGDELVD